VLPKLNLFDSRGGVWLFVSAMLALLSLNLYLKYQDYTHFKSSKIYRTKATLLNQYPKFSKRGKKYFVLRLKSDDGFKLITTNFGDLKDIKGRRVGVAIITKNVDFIEYLKGFFAPTFDLELLEFKNSFKNSLKNYIDSQHSHKWTKELFEALFLAIPVSKEFRKMVSNLGINHLLAISGYHLGFLYAIVIFVIGYIYRFFQLRYFPYRNRNFDLSIFALFLLGFYIYIIGYTPSIIRSFSMLLFGLYLYMRWYKIVSFEVLGVSVLFLLSIKPELFFSVSFWFSVSGIFFIYLFLHYFKRLNTFKMLLGINFWVYIAMIPVVHYIFPLFASWQVFSPILSLIFVIFYPIELVLHLIGFGGLLDPYLLKLFSFEGIHTAVATPVWFLVIYVLLSLGAVFSKRVFYLLILSSLLFFLRAVFLL
jgi:competence protein ComEC